MLHKKGLGVLLLVHYRKKDSVLVFKSSHLIGQADQPQDSFCCHRHHHRKAYTVPNEIDFPCYNMKCSGENVILRGIFNVVSCFPVHFILYRGNLDYFSRRMYGCNYICY